MHAEAAERSLTEPVTGLLGELAVHERNAIRRASQVQFCAAGDVLLHANTPSRSVFFPISAVVSTVRCIRNDRGVAVGLFGNEGLAGLDVILETKARPEDAVVQSAGFVYCMPADDVRHQFVAAGRLQKSIFRFTHAFLGQVAQNAVCARYHPVRQRVAKWLLMIDDRSGSIEVSKSRRLLAKALGADEREIDGALTELASAGALEPRRSTIAIRRDELEVGACECYDAVQISARVAS